MSILHMLNKTMNITRPTDVVTAGRTVTTYNAHLSAVPCRWHQLSGSETVRSGAERGINAWRVSFPPGYDILRRDRAAFTDEDGATHTIDIMSVRNSSQGFGASGIIKVMEGEEVS